MDYPVHEDVKLYDVQEMSTDKAIELLRKQLKTHSTARLHQMLADLLAKTHDEEQALEHYTIGKKSGLNTTLRSTQGVSEDKYQLLE